MRTLAVLLFVLFSVGAVAQDSGVVGSPTLLPRVAADEGVTPHGSVPVPDPTKLTQEAVDRAIVQLSALFKVQLEAIVARMDRIQQTLDARPDEVDKTVTHAIATLQELVQQKFTGVDQQFAGRDTALAAALLAQKTAVDEQNRANALSIAKSDAATVKQIDAIGLNVETANKGINDKIDDLRTRVQSIESRALGVNENRDSSFSTLNIIFAGVGALGVLAAVWFASRHPPVSRRT